MRSWELLWVNSKIEHHACDLATVNLLLFIWIGLQGLNNFPWLLPHKVLPDIPNCHLKDNIKINFVLVKCCTHKKILIVHHCGCNLFWISKTWRHHERVKFLLCIFFFYDFLLLFFCYFHELFCFIPTERMKCNF